MHAQAKGHSPSPALLGALQMNTVGQADGAVLLTLNGFPLLSFGNLVIRSNPQQTVEAVSHLRP